MEREKIAQLYLDVLYSTLGCVDTYTYTFYKGHKLMLQKKQKKQNNN